MLLHLLLVPDFVHIMVHTENMYALIVACEQMRADANRACISTNADRWCYCAHSRCVTWTTSQVSYRNEQGTHKKIVVK
jgi:hypothetical protein